jgi:hypothetical protein
MNIHCSACGTPLPQGARFCPTCALPLTAIAMPTPAPIRRRAPIWPYFAAAFLLFWIIAYTSDHVTEAHRQAQQEASVPVALTPAQVKADEAIDARFEREIDAEIWNSPERLRDRIVLLAPRQDAVAQRATARIEARLKELGAK